jgi:addiction module RelE/StbE family toxin
LVIWTPRAHADLKAIHDHIAKDAPQNAKKITREMVQKAHLLMEVPQIGRKLPEVNDDDLREISLHPWRIIYHLRQGKIFVVTVVHKRRQLDADDLTREQ